MPAVIYKYQYVMSNSKQNDNTSNMVNDSIEPLIAAPHADQNEDSNKHLSVYLSIIIALFSLSAIFQLFLYSFPGHPFPGYAFFPKQIARNLPAIQTVLLVTGVMLSIYTFFLAKKSMRIPEKNSHLHLLSERIALKTHSLEILYDAAAGVTDFHSLDDLLKRFLITLKNLVHAQAVIVRLRDDSDKMRLVAKTGISDDDETPRLISLTECLKGSPIGNSPILKTTITSNRLPKLTTIEKNRLSLVTVPIQYSGKTLGAYHLYVNSTELFERKELIQLFTSIGRHLGIVVEKVKLENHARRISIIKERTSLANELHDSLAQTLASLRFQVTMVDETVSESRDRTGILQIRAIKEGLDQANNQLRELLSHFRTRMDERGLLPAIESLVERFQLETGVAAFFQNEVKQPISSPAVEVQVLHIVQEALANVRKHSRAHNVRILIRSDDNRNYYVLVEDDGQGIQNKNLTAGPGKHIGLSIMQERAERLSGTFNIETEAGEGTRVELRFQAPLDSKSI